MKLQKIGRKLFSKLGKFSTKDVIIRNGNSWWPYLRTAALLREA
jgi:hypothetical protein